MPLRVAVMGCVVNGPGRGSRGRPRRRVRQRQGPDLRQGRGDQDRARVADRRDPDRGGHADRRGHGVRRRRAAPRSPSPRSGLAAEPSTRRLRPCSRPATASACSASPTSPSSWRLAGRDPVVNVFADYRARTTNLEPRWLGGEMWGRFDDGGSTAACHVGANLVPVQAEPRTTPAVVRRARARPGAARSPRSSARRPRCARSGTASAALGPPARAALGPAAPGDRRPAGRRARPGRTSQHRPTT